LFQVEYACEAVKHGGASVGIVSKDFAVLASIRRSESELASYIQKIFRVDDHIGLAISGLIPDGRAAVQTLRQECLDHKWRYESPIPVGRLAAMISDENQARTQGSSGRPTGVGLLIIGYDATGPHLYETSPAGTFYEYRAQAIGARSQSSKTYLENNVDSFADMGLNDLIVHAVRALKGAAQTKLTSSNVSIGFVGKNTKFTVLVDDDVAQYVASANDEAGDEADEMGVGGPAPAGGAGAGAAPQSGAAAAAAAVISDDDD